MTEIRTTLVVIGGGPGGYVCASRAARLGVDTVLIEKDRLGGTCLNVGCIPSKSLIHAADLYATACEQAKAGTCGVMVQEPTLDFTATRGWMDGVTGKLRGGVTVLMEKSGVKTLFGHARFIDGKTLEVAGETGTTIVRASYVVIATGSSPVELPGLPTGGDVLDSAAALALPEPPERLAVIGAGYIGLELGTAFAKLGSKVTLIEAADGILPQYDEKLVRPVKRRLGELGIDLKTDTRVRDWNDKARTLTVSAGDTTERLPFDKILITVGRTPNTQGLGLAELQLQMDGPFIRIDEECRTSMRDVFAIGDVTPGLMLAHRATAQAALVADIVCGTAAAWDTTCIPTVCFTDPEIASVGLSPAEAKSLGPIEISEFSFRANGRALTLDDPEGFVRLVVRSSDHVILGVQATGAGISEMVGEFSLAIESGLRAEDLAASIHPHPSLSEAVQESALGLTSMSNHG